MSQAEGSDRVLWAIPSRAEAAWLELRAGLEEVGTVPCQESDNAAWWPDKRDLASPATHSAIAACRRSPLQAPCSQYAFAADGVGLGRCATLSLNGPSRDSVADGYDGSCPVSHPLDCIGSRRMMRRMRRQS